MIESTIDTGVVDVAKKIEGVWGNQGVYGSKINDLVTSIAKNISKKIRDTKQENEGSKQGFISEEQMEENFDRLIGVVNAEDFDILFKAFIGRSSSFLNQSQNVKRFLIKENPTIRKIDEIIPGSKRRIHERDVSRLNGDNDTGGILDRDTVMRLLVHIEEVHLVIKEIIRMNSTFALKASSFTKDRFVILSDAVYAENNTMHFDVKKAISISEELFSTYDKKTFSDDFNLYVAAYMENLWFLLEIMRNTPLIKGRNEAIMEEYKYILIWKERTCARVDMIKYSNEHDLVKIYLDLYEYLIKNGIYPIFK